MPEDPSFRDYCESIIIERSLDREASSQTIYERARIRADIMGAKREANSLKNRFLRWVKSTFVQSGGTPL